MTREETGLVMENKANIKQLIDSTALENLRMLLLDLTALNRLINFHQTKSSSLRIIDELPNQLVGIFMADIEMNFMPVPEPPKKGLLMLVNGFSNQAYQSLTGKRVYE